MIAATNHRPDTLKEGLAILKEVLIALPDGLPAA